MQQTPKYPINCRLPVSVSSFVSFNTALSPYINLYTHCLNGCEQLLCARNHTRVEGMRVLGSLGIQGPGAALLCIGVRGVQLGYGERLHWLHAESKGWRGDVVPEKGRQGLHGCHRHTIHPQVQSSLVGLPSTDSPDRLRCESPGNGASVWRCPAPPAKLHRCQHTPPQPGAAGLMG